MTKPIGTVESAAPGCAAVKHDEIIKLAREAGFLQHGNRKFAEHEAILRFAALVAALVAAAERIGYCTAIDEIDDGETHEYRACQEAIRARGHT